MYRFLLIKCPCLCGSAGSVIFFIRINKFFLSVKIWFFELKTPWYDDLFVHSLHRSSHRCSVKKADCNFIKKKLQHKCFSVNIAEFFKGTYVEKHLRTAASIYIQQNYVSTNFTKTSVGPVFHTLKSLWNLGRNAETF